MSSSRLMGPRAKCDQVVYEAIAKAAEIIIRGRCAHIPSRKSHGLNVGMGKNQSPETGFSASNNTAPASAGGLFSHAPSNKNSNNQSPSSSTSSSGVTYGGSSSRFNLEVEEVESVRSILQMWKQSLHVPLRLDVYYEYCTDLPEIPDQCIPIDPSHRQYQKTPLRKNKNSKNSSRPTNTRKELLERWCIDYVATSSSTTNSSSNSNFPNTYHSSTSNNATHSPDDHIVRLRQVCKRVVFFLRSLYGLTRIMPAYSLHRALLNTHETSSTQCGYYNNVNSNDNQNVINRLNEREQDNLAIEKEWFDAVGGKILFSFYVSSCEGDGRDSSEHALFSSSTNNPFARREMNSIPTPYGLLHVNAMFDEGLDIEQTIMQRGKRLALCRDRLALYFHTISGAANSDLYADEVSNTGDNNLSQTTRSRAIPIQGCGIRDENRFQNIHDCGENEQMQPFQNSSIDNNSFAQSKNVVSNHLIQNYAISPGSFPKSSSVTMRSHSNSPSTNQCLNHRSRSVSIGSQCSSNGSHAGRGALLTPRPVTSDNAFAEGKNGRGLKNGKVLSGLSLVLMNEKSTHADNNNLTRRSRSNSHNSEYYMSSRNGDHDENKLANTSRSRTNSVGDDLATRRQRLAFHHPPPSFGTTTTNAAHIDAGGGSSNGIVGNSDDYGYGYNSGKSQTNLLAHVEINQHNNQTNVGTTPSISSSPNLTASPHQPMFIGSAGTTTSHLINAMDISLKSTEVKTQTEGNFSTTVINPIGGRISPPFKNPITLNRIPSNDGSKSFSSSVGGGCAPIAPRRRSSNSSPESVGLCSAKGSVIAAAAFNLDNANTTGEDKRLLLPPLTSLDTLTASPFKIASSCLNVGAEPTEVHGKSIFSHIGMGSGLANVDAPMLFGGISLTPPGGLAGMSSLTVLADSNLQDRHRSRNHPNNAIRNSISNVHNIEEMPFAVDVDGGNDLSLTLSGKGAFSNFGSGQILDHDIPGSTHSNNEIMGATTSSFGTTNSSHAVASLAHRCATAGRLKLFNSSTQKNEIENVDNVGCNQDTSSTLSCQLKEYHESSNYSSTSENNEINMTGIEVEHTSLASNCNDNFALSSIADQLAEFHSFGESLIVGSGSSNRAAAGN